MDLNEKLKAANEADQNKNYTEAAKLYREILQKAPENTHGKLNLYLGVSLFNNQNFNESLTAFDEALKSNDPEITANCHSGKARAFERLQNWPEAVKSHAACEQTDKERKFFKWAPFAHACNQAQEFEQALDAAAKGLDEQPEDFEKFHNERIFAFFKLNQPMNCLEDVEAVLSKKPIAELREEQVQLYSEVIIQKGHQLMLENNLQEAKKYFQKAHDMNGSVNSKFLLGVTSLRLKEDKLAEKWISEAIASADSSEPETWKYHVALGTVYMRQDLLSYEKAVEQFEKAISLSPEAKNANVCFNAGFALMKLQKDDLARERLEFVYNVDKKNWVAAALLGTIMVNKAEYEPAIGVLLHAIEASNGEADDSVYYNLAYAYMMLNKWKEAEKYFKKALEKNPNNEAARSAAERMSHEVAKEEEEEKERIRQEEERKREAEAEAERIRQIEEMKKKQLEKEKIEAAEKAAREEKERVEEEQKQRKIKIQEARERKRKRLEELRVKIGGPQTYRPRRPSLEAIPVGNTGNNATKYVEWYNKKIVHAPDNV